MLPTTLASMRQHLGRLVATTFAVVCGVAFIAGTLIFGDTARAGYSQAFARSVANVDVVVQPADLDNGALTADQLATVRSVSGVAVADGRAVANLALLNRKGRAVTNFGFVGVAISTDGDPAMRPYDVIGRVPGVGEAMLDTETAERLGYGIGDTITVVDLDENRHSYRLVGLIDFGDSRQYSGSSVVGVPTQTIDALTGNNGFNEIVIRGDGTDPVQVAAAVAAALGDGPRVATGDERRKALEDQAGAWSVSFQVLLLLFGVVALIVAAFVIYNTFAVLAALRVRQTALQRCVGATRGQIFRATLVESAVIGLVGGALGTVLGVGVRYGLVALLNSTVDAGIPVDAPVLRPTPVVVGLLVGLVVTVAAAFVPAVRATRTSPLSALRDQATPTLAARARTVRIALASLVGAAGIGVTVLGARTADLQTSVVIIVAGGLITFLGLLIAAPTFVGPLTTVVGALPARLLGSAARLAVTNGRRNPGRAAATTAPLMIGVGLMSLFSVALQSMDVTASRQISAQYPVDFVVTGLSYGTGDPALPAGYADAVRGRAEFAGVAQIRTASATVDGKSIRIGAIDPAALGTLITPPISQGSLADLRPGTAIVASSPNTIGDTPVGTTLTVSGAASTTPLRIVAATTVLAPGTGNLDLLVVWSDFAALAGDVPDSVVLAKAAPGVSPAAAAAALDSLADSYPLVSVGSVAGLSSDTRSVVDDLLALVAGLLAITVAISLFGIANTLALSVTERTRESATVRALGLTRGQLRATLLIEALLMAMVGALVGLAFGLLYGAVLVTSALHALQPVLVLPWVWLAAILVLATVTAVLAAVLPSRRAAKASIVAAMADT